MQPDFFLAIARSIELDCFSERCRFDVAEREERTIDAMCDLVGEDHIVWGGDYPHIDSRLDARPLIDVSVAGLAPARRDKVLGENAINLFAL